jgi:hypothetical protein
MIEDLSALQLGLVQLTVTGGHTGLRQWTGHCDGRSTVSNRMRPHFAHGDGTGMGSSALVKSPQLEHIHARLRSRPARVTTLSGKPMRFVICFSLMPEM